ncbi:MAG: hypothetical protein M1831_005684 [Alyxoria varia]|nr:MAG: hypothetical protein M1831_005684 [Alyxoria varia]
MPPKPPTPSGRNNALDSASTDMPKTRKRGATESAAAAETPNKSAKRSGRGAQAAKLEESAEIEEEEEEFITPRKSARSGAARKRYKEESDEAIAEEDEIKEDNPPRKKARRTADRQTHQEDSDRTVKPEEETVNGEDLSKPSKGKPKSAASTTKKTSQKSANDGEPSASTTTPADQPLTSTKPKQKQPRKTAQEKEAESMPLAPRTTLASTVLRVGAHVSAAGGVHNSISNAHKIGGNALALFLKSQRKWANPPLQSTVSSQFRRACLTENYDARAHILPHGSYLVNLAVEEKARVDQAYDSFLDDLLRCQRLGIRYYNFHPGNTNGKPRDEAIARLAERINRAHRETAEAAERHNAELGQPKHSPKPNGENNGASENHDDDDTKEIEPQRQELVTTVFENMAASSTTSNTLGGSFPELASIISLVEDKSRVAVCLDTCHAFAAGYDLRTPEAYAATMKEFDQAIGARYLRAVHVNDSKTGLGSHRDLHQNLGVGFLGLKAFWNLVNDERYWVGGVAEAAAKEEDDGDRKKKEGIPLILETPQAYKKNPKTGKDVEDDSVYAREIKLLESLVGMDPEGSEFKGLEAELAEKGREEREKMKIKEDEKAEKAKRGAKGKGEKGGKKKGKALEESSDEEEE